MSYTAAREASMQSSLIVPARVAWAIATLVIAACAAISFHAQRILDLHVDGHTARIEELAQLPKGEYIKPVLLGYHHLGADLLWLRMVQVLGNKQNTSDQFEWMYHAVDVITTLDPNYVYAYYVGGVALANLANRADLANRLLEKGHAENPQEWSLPFLLGHNYYFMLADAGKGAEYLGRAARLPGAPDFLPGLATRMFAEAGNPEVALQFLQAMWKVNPDLAVREKLEERAKEVLIERDIRAIEDAAGKYRERRKVLPKSVGTLVAEGYLPKMPQEPFGGVYQFDPGTGRVASSTHPNRLKVFRRDLETGIDMGVQ